MPGSVRGPVSVHSDLVRESVWVQLDSVHESVSVHIGFARPARFINRFSREPPKVVGKQKCNVIRN